MTRIPMPSPRGTNKARLFINNNPMGAYDEMPDDADAAALLEFLRDKLNPEDHAAVAKMLGADPDAAMDEPADFTGKPLVGGGKFGQDAAMSTVINRIRTNAAKIAVSR